MQNLAEVFDTNFTGKSRWYPSGDYRVMTAKRGNGERVAIVIVPPESKHAIARCYTARYVYSIYGVWRVGSSIGYSPRITTKFLNSIESKAMSRGLGLVDEDLSK